jgi:predicted patatin/cPLA2 family phospholipase
MDIDYLVDYVIKVQHPLNLKSLLKNPIELEVGVTNATTGQPKFFSKRDVPNFYDLIRASCAVPYFARDKVRIGKADYYDGTIGSSTGLEQVKDEQNVLIVLIRDKPRSYPNLVRNPASWLFMRSETPKLQEAIWKMVARYDKLLSDIEKLKFGKNVAVIQPSRAMPMFRVDTSLQRLKKTIQLGYQDTLRHKGLDAFFAKISQ